MDTRFPHVCLIPFKNKWRDHWMQAIYFPKNYLNLQENDEFYLNCNHDEYSLWFDVSKDVTALNDKMPDVTLSLMSRNRLLQVNDKHRNDMFLNIFKQV